MKRSLKIGFMEEMVQELTFISTKPIKDQMLGQLQEPMKKKDLNGSTKTQLVKNGKLGSAQLMLTIT